jgi:antitoxin (DNA-binding transcriptional repressor) of toxin-antitoxin stability system
MKELSMLELRLETKKVVEWLRHGKERIRLTYRGKPLADIVPITESADASDSLDPLYHLAEHAVVGRSLTNEEIDRAIYEER